MIKTGQLYKFDKNASVRTTLRDKFVIILGCFNVTDSFESKHKTCVECYVFNSKNEGIEQLYEFVFIERGILIA